MNAMNERHFDELDFAILAHIQKDGRKSFTEIGIDLDIATNTVRNRVNRMQMDEVIKIIAQVDPHYAGFDASADIRVSVEPSSLIEVAACKFRCDGVW
jgi:Lrp/AsnC family transcriptional regulator for asnA, asnC and gidA